jgi:ribonuclease P protein component
MGLLGETRRLRKRTEYLRVQQNGRRFRRRHLMVLLAKTPQPEAGVGITITRKVGNAVMRNRIRRRLREIIRCNEQTLVGGYDHVVIVHPSAAVANQSSLQNDYLRVMQEAETWASSHEPS